MIADVQSLRSKIAGLRKELPLEKNQADSRLATQRLLSEFTQWKDKNIALYRPLIGELDLDFLEKFCSELGAKLHYPRIAFGSLIEMVPMSYPRISDEWEISSLGFIQPCFQFKAVDSSILDAVIVPGVAFGESGQRIGRGVGYYDRFLPQCTRAVRIALAFDFQVFPHLPQNPWDERVHWIFTQSREINANNENSVFW